VQNGSPDAKKEPTVEITEDISAAINQHQEAVNSVSEALKPYRRDRATPEAGAEPETQLDQATERYERSSSRLTGLILEQLVVFREGEEADPEGTIGLFDDDATTRLTILIGIDARIAAQAGTLAEARAPVAGADVSSPRPLTELELDDVGPPLADACEPMFSELRQDANEQDDKPDEQDEQDEDEPPPGDGRSPASPEVKQFFDEILNRSGGDIFGTLASSLSWLNRIGAVLADPTASFISWSNDALQQGMSALKKLISASWRQVLTKVAALAGEHAAQVGALAADLVRTFKVPRDIAGRGTGFLLGKLLNIKAVRVEAQTLITQNPSRAGGAIRACQDVSKHHKKRRRPVPWLNKALPTCRLIPAYGVGIEAIAAATLLIYSIWLAHDHLDSPILARLRLPKNPGMLTEIKAAVR
jgi:hypothetical protein